MYDDAMRQPGRVRVEGEQKPFAQRFAKQIVFTMAASMVGGLLLKTPYLWEGVKWVASVINHFGGDPIDEAVTKAKEKFETLPLPHDMPPGAKPGLPVVVPTLNPFHKSQAEIEAEARRKEEERQRKEAAERQKWLARAEAVGLEVGDDWTLDKLRVQVPLAEDKAEYDAKRAELIKQADALKMPVNDDWNNETLDDEIKIEKKFQWDDADHQEKMRRWREAMEKWREFMKAGPYGKCPNSRCNHLMHFNPNRQGRFVCPKCHQHSSVSQARACFTPPKAPKEPQPPQRRGGLLDKAKRAIGL